MTRFPRGLGQESVEKAKGCDLRPGWSGALRGVSAGSPIAEQHQLKAAARTAVVLSGDGLQPSPNAFCKSRGTLESTNGTCWAESRLVVSMAGVRLREIRGDST